MRIIKAIFSAALVFCITLCGAAGVKGSMQPSVLPVDTREALTAWYTGTANSVVKLTADISVEDELTLSETDRMREIGAIEHVFRVKDGGVLILDNPNVVLQGPETVVVVEDGGALELRRGAVYTGPGSAVVVEKGGEITQLSGFEIHGGTVEDKNEASIEPTPTAVPTASPSPTPAASASPTAMPTPSPKPTASPIDSMEGRFVRVESTGRALVQLKLPALPEDTAALYVYRSADGESWEQASIMVAQETFTDFLPFAQRQEKNCYVAYRFASDYQDIWFKVQVVGSVYEGFSNAVCVAVPPDAKPGAVATPGSDPDDGSSEGDRGGGGQEEADRVLPPDVPAQSEANAPVQKPGASVTPESSVTPEASVKPKASVTPEASVKPEASVMPEASVTPEETAEPEAKPAAAETEPPAAQSRGVMTVAAVSAGAVVLAGICTALLYRRKKAKHGGKKS